MLLYEAKGTVDSAGDPSGIFGSPETSFIGQPISMRLYYPSKGIYFDGAEYEYTSGLVRGFGLQGDLKRLSAIMD